MAAKTQESPASDARTAALADAKSGGADHDNPPSGPGKKPAPVEVGGRKGPDPTRFGDWEKNGRCIDF